MISGTAISGIICTYFLAVASMTSAASPVTVTLKGSDGGRVFEGIGAVMPRGVDTIVVRLCPN